jgi:hypothetical protein
MKLELGNRLPACCLAHLRLHRDAALCRDELDVAQVEVERDRPEGGKGRVLTGMQAVTISADRKIKDDGNCASMTAETLAPVVRSIPLPRTDLHDYAIVFAAA